mgnify:CR=1 FL=1
MIGDHPDLSVGSLNDHDGDFREGDIFRWSYRDPNADNYELNHSNSPRGNFYLRKGAVRSQKKQLEVARRKLEQSLTDERVAALQSEQLRATISRLEAGEVL